MNHRQIDTATWPTIAIDSCCERGDLPDWKELFPDVRKDRKLAEMVLSRARPSVEPGVALLVSHYVDKHWLRH